MNKVRHFRSLLDINKNEFIKLIERSIELKKESKENISNNSLQDKTMAMIFKKNSTRTRVAFETAMVTMAATRFFYRQIQLKLLEGKTWLIPQKFYLEWLI